MLGNIATLSIVCPSKDQRAPRLATGSFLGQGSPPRPHYLQWPQEFNKSCGFSPQENADSIPWLPAAIWGPLGIRGPYLRIFEFSPMTHLKMGNRALRVRNGLPRIIPPVGSRAGNRSLVLSGWLFQHTATCFPSTADAWTPTKPSAASGPSDFPQPILNPSPCLAGRPRGETNLELLPKVTQKPRKVKWRRKDHQETHPWN